MTYRVIYAESFLEHVETHVDYLLGERVAIDVIEGWYSRLLDRLDRLDELPKRLPVDEVQTRLTGCETRKVKFGDYLVFYQVDDERKHVNVVGFMHGARRREA